jgi:hypothetical protein
MRLITLLIVATGLTNGTLTYAEEGGGGSQGSARSVETASAIVAGSVEVIAASHTLTVQAVNIAADSIIVVLKGASASVSVHVASELAGHLSKAVGATVDVVTESSGYALMYMGKMIAFIPNEVSENLLHHAPHRP